MAHPWKALLPMDSTEGKFRGVDFNTTDAPGMNTERVFRDYMEYREAMIAVAKGRDPSAEVPDKLLIYMSRGRLGAFSEKGVAIDNRLKEVSAIVGVRFSNHTLRRTFGRNLFQNGVKV